MQFFRGREGKRREEKEREERRLRRRETSKGLGDIERETMGPIELGKETRTFGNPLRETRRSRTVKSGEELRRTKSAVSASKPQWPWLSREAICSCTVAFACGVEGRRRRTQRREGGISPQGGKRKVSD